MIKKIRATFGTVSEILEFLGKEKLWWLIPPIAILLIFGVLIMIGHGSVIAPFIYPLF